MHICFISHEYPLWATGGIGSFIQTLGRGLVKKGHMVTVVGIGNKRETIQMVDEGVEIFRLPHSGRKRFSFIANTINIRHFLVNRNQLHPIDIVETPESGLAFLPQRTPYKKVIRLHGGHHFFAESENRPINWWKGFQEKLSFKKADAFIAVSEYVKNQNGKYLSFNGKPVRIIRYPLDSELFCPSSNSFVPNRLVFAGTVCEKKGIRQLLQALPSVLAKFPEVELMVYGRDWFFPNRQSYIEMLKSCFSKEIIDHVKFMGPLERVQMPDAYRSGYVCVFPSHMETLGLVAPEAMLTGRPVIFTTAGPGPEVVEHGVTGLLCNPHDASDIAEKILYALEHHEEMERIAHEGRKYILEAFDSDRLIDENIEFYNFLKQS